MRIGAFGRVYSIDPNAFVLEHLQRSLDINWLQHRTVVINQAIGSTAGEITLRYSEQMLGSGNVSTVQSNAFSETNKILGEATEKRVHQGRLDGEGLFAEDPGFVFNPHGSRNIVFRRC